MTSEKPLIAEKTVVVFSGGLDSTTLLYHLRDAGHTLKALSVNYGQRHFRELEAARRVCELTNVEHRIVDLRGLADLFGTNALTSSAVAVPDGAYSPRTMAVTTVPNRNMILLSIATAWALTSEFDAVSFAAHSGEYTPYPDCRGQFVEAMDGTAQVCAERRIRVRAPFVHWDKSDIVRRGHQLGVPFEITWSCYKDGETHCGQCSTCLDRKQAFEKCQLDDAIDYVV